MTIDFRALAEPFTKKEVKSKPAGGGKIVSFITARHVMNRLDQVCGPENWRDEYREVDGGILCTLYIRIDGEWVGKSDAGDSEGSNYSPFKGQYSDALKRAAVRWGIGRELYNDGTAFDEDDPQPEPKPAPAARPPRITDAPEAPDPVQESGADLWWRDDKAVKSMVDKARALWKDDDGNEPQWSHTYTRIMRALGKPATPRKLADLMIELDNDPPPDRYATWAAIQRYTPSDAKAG